MLVPAPGSAPEGRDGRRNSGSAAAAARGGLRRRRGGLLAAGGRGQEGGPAAEGRPVTDGAAWLRGLGLGRYEAAFRDNEIRADLLPRLTADHLKDIRVA